MEIVILSTESMTDGRLLAEWTSTQPGTPREAALWAAVVRRRDVRVKVAALAAAEEKLREKAAKVTGSEVTESEQGDGDHE